jgi:purine-binding chemotaxis protein CheW
MVDILSDYKVLVFKVGQEEFGLHISQIVSIERMQGINISSYPNRQPHVLGFSSIRNVVTPIVDLRSALNGNSLNHTEGTRIIVVKVLGKEIGLLVDQATDVLDVPDETIQYPNLMESKEASYLKGVAKMDNRYVILLDIEKLLEDTTNLDELKEIIENFIDREESLESEKER